jgi:hypothetical protein
MSRGERAETADVPASAQRGSGPAAGRQAPAGGLGDMLGAERR